jgi:hypothetical protein
VPFVPGEKSEHKETEPLFRLAGWGFGFASGKGGLFEGGLATRHFTLVSNIWDWEARRLMQWHQEKAGMIEAVHDVLKNELAGGVLPCKYYGLTPPGCGWR